MHLPKQNDLHHSIKDSPFFLWPLHSALSVTVAMPICFIDFDKINSICPRFSLKSKKNSHLSIENTANGYANSRAILHSDNSHLTHQNWIKTNHYYNSTSTPNGLIIRYSWFFTEIENKRIGIMCKGLYWNVLEVPSITENSSTIVQEKAVVPIEVWCHWKNTCSQRSYILARMSKKLPSRVTGGPIFSDPTISWNDIYFME